MIKYAIVLLLGALPLVVMTGMSFIEVVQGPAADPDEILLAGAEPGKGPTEASEAIKAAAEKTREEVRARSSKEVNFAEQLATMNLLTAAGPAAKDFSAPRDLLAAWERLKSRHDWVDQFPVTGNPAPIESSAMSEQQLKDTLGQLEGTDEKFKTLATELDHAKADPDGDKVEQLLELVLARRAKLAKTIAEVKQELKVRETLASAERAIDQGNYEPGLMLKDKLPSGVDSPKADELGRRADYLRQCAKYREQLQQIALKVKGFVDLGNQDPSVLNDYEQALDSIKIDFLAKPAPGMNPKSTPEGRQLDELKRQCRDAEKKLAWARVETATDFVTLLHGADVILGGDNDLDGANHETERVGQIARLQVLVGDWLKEHIRTQDIPDAIVGEQEVERAEGGLLVGIFDEPAAPGDPEVYFRYWRNVQQRRSNPGVSMSQPPHLKVPRDIKTEPVSITYLRLAKEYNEARDRLFKNDRPRDDRDDADWRQFVKTCEDLEKRLNDYRTRWAENVGTPEFLACKDWSFKRYGDRAQEVVENWKKFRKVRLVHAR